MKRTLAYVPAIHSMTQRSLYLPHSVSLCSRKNFSPTPIRNYADFSDIFKQLEKEPPTKAEEMDGSVANSDDNVEEKEMELIRKKSKGYDLNLNDVVSKLRKESRMGTTIDHEEMRKRFELAMQYKLKREEENRQRAEKEIEEGKKKSAAEWEQYLAQMQKKKKGWF